MTGKLNSSSPSTVNQVPQFSLRVWAVNTVDSLRNGQISALYRALHKDEITTATYDAFVAFSEGSPTVKN